MRTLGRMRGRPCTQPFLVEIKKGAAGCRPNGGFSPAPLGKSVAPSSVTFGDSFPPRGSLRRWYTPATKCLLTQTLLPQNANPNQGMYMDIVIAPPPGQCGTTAKTSERQRAGHNPRGAGGHPPRLFASGLSPRESLDPPPGTGRETHAAGANLRRPPPGPPAGGSTVLRTLWVAGAAPLDPGLYNRSFPLASFCGSFL